MTDRDLLSQALDALRQCEFTSPPAQRPIVKDAITALREALAAPMPEPVAFVDGDEAHRKIIWSKCVASFDYEIGAPLYAAPPAAPAPGGMVMVPREPTPEMIEAADQSDKEYSLRSFGPGTVVAQSGYDHWVAMIAAAPPAAPAPVVREPLTQDQIISLAENYEERYHRWVFICVDELEQFARAIEKAHGIGGGGK